ncbi:hypothetical protein GSI_13890 [Ganoderma sinense ZZ0214-1]|uniref:DUF6533 domain-containing protein n=1 Tax=Ganoderma sinense ZZ0214-1 TaxID=1077348 RepID=A0A2G8RS30_9APHY|nr:hypothetical protein GSI_13890 [Ganoderma sinense ZZ0214-1]
MEVISNASPWSASTQRSIYSAVSAAALIVFEYIITLDREIDFLRGRKFSWAKCIFLLNRYGSIVNYLAIMVMALPTTDLMVNTDHGVPVSTIGRVFALLSNTIVLAATWLGTRHTIQTGKEVGLSTVFASFLFWNGLRTFAFLIVMNVVQIVLSCFRIDGIAFLDLPRVLISICVSRFFLSLHRLGTHDPHESLSLPPFSSIHTFEHGESIGLSEWK